MILLTDSNSRVPVTIQPSGQRALLSGDNSALPPVEFLEAPELVRPGDRVVSSGDGKVFPAGLLVGQIVAGTDRRLRVRLAAEYDRLEFLRVLSRPEGETLADPGGLVAPGPGAEPQTEQEARRSRRRSRQMVDAVTAERWRYHGSSPARRLASCWSRCCRSATARAACRAPTCPQ